MNLLCRIGLHDTMWFADSEGTWNWCKRCHKKEDQWTGHWPFLTRLKWKIFATANIWIRRRS
jgi:hypothetical protein